MHDSNSFDINHGMIKMHLRWFTQSREKYVILTYLIRTDQYVK